MAVKLSERIIQKTFKRDIGTLTDIDFIGMIQWFKDFVGSINADKMILKTILDPMRQVSHCLTFIEQEYFKYDPERFPDPMDQYIYIHESKDEIMDMIKKLEPKTPMEDIVLFTLFKRVYGRIERVCDFIVMRGKEHRFKYEALEEIFGTNGMKT